MKKKRAFNLDDLPDHIKALNKALFPGFNPQGGLEDTNTAKPARNAITADLGHTSKASPTRENQLNKTESRFLQLVRQHVAGLATPELPELDAFGEIWAVDIQPSRFFQFEDCDTYTPDFILNLSCGLQVIAEIKGGYRGPGWEQGYERFKRAALAFSTPGRRVFYMFEWSRAAGTWKVKKY